MIRLLLPLPPSVNKTNRAGINWKAGKVYKPHAHLKEEYFEWTKLAAIAERVFGRGMEGALSFTVTWYFPDRTYGDGDNRIKTLSDAVAKAVGYDDRQISEWHIYRRIGERKEANCEVTICELAYEEVK